MNDNTCKRCNGFGWLFAGQYVGDRYVTAKRKCYECEGTGISQQCSESSSDSKDMLCDFAPY